MAVSSLFTRALLLLLLGLQVEGLNATILPLLAKTGNTLFLSLSWDRGTDVTFNLTYDAAIQPMTPDVEWNWVDAGHVSSFMFHEVPITWAYASHRNYSILLSIGNEVAVWERWFNVTIEPHLPDLIFLDVDYIPSASPVGIHTWIKFSVSEERFPINVWCRVDLGDGNYRPIFAEILQDKSILNYTYLTDAANASLLVECHNHFSSISLNEEIVLRTNISNLTVSAERGACAVGSDCIFTVSMDAGSHVAYLIATGDGTGQLGYQDTDRIASSSEFSFAYAYAMPDNYSIHVYAYNEHFHAEATLVPSVIVQTPVPGLYLEGPAIVVVPGGSAEFVLTSVSGEENLLPSEVFCRWNFSSTESLTYYSTELMQNRSEEKVFVYQRNDIGEPFNISVSCYNLVSESHASLSLQVEEELNGLIVLPFGQLGVTAKSNMGFQITLSAGSHMHAEVDYGDGTFEIVSHPELFAVSAPTVVWHRYDTPGNYSVNVTAWNLANQVAGATEELIIQNEVTNLSLLANESVLWPPGEMELLLEAGRGQEDLDNLHCLWAFDIPHEEYLFLPSLTLTKPFKRTYTFPKSAIGNNTAIVNCSNLVSWQEAQTAIEIIFDEVILDSLQTNGPVLWSNITVLTLDIRRFGSHSCFNWSLGDGTTILYGVLSCQDFVAGDGIEFSEIPIGQQIISLSHTYPDIGEYTATVYAFNHVSNDTLQVVSIIRDWPCERPIVSFHSRSFEILRSESFELTSNVTVNCTKTTQFNATWEILVKGDQDPIIEVSGFEREQFAINSRSLGYGLYDIIYTVALFSSHPVLRVDGMETVATLELEVTKTPLVVGIVNGPDHGSAWNKTVMINAESVTYDPDYPEDGHSLHYAWFCRLAAQSFQMVGDLVSRAQPSPGVQIDPILGYGGCFGDGPGIIPYTSGKFMLDTERMTVLTAYVLRVEVTKDNRVGYSEQNYFVGTADPPSITLL